MSDIKNTVQNADVITVPPTSSGFNPIEDRENDVVDQKKINESRSTFVDESLNTCCGDDCELCCDFFCGLIRIICCIRCWSDLTGSSDNADLCCCCENAECCDCVGDGCCDACCECCN